MNGLILFLGEAFRFGGQGSQNRGSPESYDEQIKASNSHIEFIEHISSKFSLNSVSVFISSYNTQYDNELIDIYKNYLVGHKLHNNLIGINNLMATSFDEINDVNKYDFVFYIRIDLFLKALFFDEFDPSYKTITFPSPSWFIDHKIGNDPKINPIMIFIPKKYYQYIKDICAIDGILWHDLWHTLVNTTCLTMNDFDFMINTYHGACSSNDWNPLYYVTNRAQCTSWVGEGQVFNKELFYSNADLCPPVSQTTKLKTK